MTNNEAEYEALIVGLDLATDMDIKHLDIIIDSQLVANQINRSYPAKDSKMATYLQLIRQKLTNFQKYSYDKFPG